MTVNVGPREADFATDGVTTVWPIPFQFLSNDDLVVSLIDAGGDEAALSDGTDYTIAGTGASGTASLTRGPADASGSTLRVRRLTTRVQATQYVPNDPFPAAAHEAALDRRALVEQEIDDDIGRTLRLPVGENAPILAKAAQRVLSILGFDGAGAFALLNYSTMAAALFTPIKALLGPSYKGDPGGDTSDVGLFASLSGITAPAGVTSVRTSGAKAPGRGRGNYAYDAAVNAGYVTAHPNASAIMADARGFRLWEPAITVEMLGAQPADADHCAVITEALAYAALSESRDIELTMPSYQVKQISGDSLQRAIQTRSNVRLRGNGATLQAANKSRMFWNDYSASAAYAAVSDIAAGAVIFPLTSGDGAHFGAGMWVLWRLTDVPYDTQETQNFGWAKVKSVSGDNVTLDRPINTAFTLAGQVYNLHLEIPSYVENQVYEDFTIDGNAGLESGIWVVRARNLTFRRIRARNVGSGAIVLQYVDGALFEDIVGDGTLITQVSYGQLIALAECVGVVGRHIRGRGFLKLIGAEDSCEASWDDIHYENIYPPTVNNSLDGSGNPIYTRPIIFNCQGKSRQYFKNLYITGYGDVVIGNVSNGTAIYDGINQGSNISVDTATELWQIPWPTRDFTGRLINTVAGVTTIYDTSALQRWERTFSLEDNMTGIFQGPPGILVGLWLFASSGLQAGDLSYFFVGRTSDNGSDLSSHFIAGEDVDYQGLAFGASAGAMWTYRDELLKILVGTPATPAAGTLNGRDVELTIVAVTMPKKGMTGIARADGAVKRQVQRENRIEGSVAITLTVNAGATSAQQSIPITGAALGDIPIGVGCGHALGGLQIVGLEIFADALKFQLINPTGGNITLTAAVFTGRVAKLDMGN